MAKKVKRTSINSERAKKLFGQLKSISAVAKRMGHTYVGVRRNLLGQGVNIKKYSK